MGGEGAFFVLNKYLFRNNATILGRLSIVNSFMAHFNFHSFSNSDAFFGFSNENFDC